MPPGMQMTGGGWKSLLGVIGFVAAGIVSVVAVAMVLGYLLAGCLTN